MIPGRDDSGGKQRAQPSYSRFTFRPETMPCSSCVTTRRRRKFSARQAIRCFLFSSSATSPARMHSITVPSASCDIGNRKLTCTPTASEHENRAVFFSIPLSRQFPMADAEIKGGVFFALGNRLCGALISDENNATQLDHTGRVLSGLPCSSDPGKEEYARSRCLTLRYPLETDRLLAGIHCPQQTKNNS